ncbi:ParM/StbA family protein [Priestia megaterium]|uniref:ParM/StbA family protein n=1 Tax=Priestia megaterium TaxID=1404 RepID=UPI002E219A83|nr:ParM/StbA family protein [Priestia megaterium]
MVKVDLRLATDLGNSEVALMESGELTLQPSTVVKVSKNPFYEDLVVADAVKDIYQQLAVSITSPALQVPALYLIGDFATESSGYYTNTILGATKKHTSDVPVVMALGMIAAKAVQKAYEKDPNLNEEIRVTVDMATGLPVREFSKESAFAFSQRFMKGNHIVKVLLGVEKQVTVDIDFDYVEVFPEAVPVAFSLVYNSENKFRKGEIFKEFQEAYGYNPFNGEYFADKRALHIDVGDGTTEFPITDGFKPNQKLAQGTNNGIGHAAENILDEYANAIFVTSVQRQDISKVLKQKTHKYHSVAMDLIQVELEKQAQEIMRKARQQLDAVQNNIDIIVVYGGGSILLKPYLYDLLAELCEQRRIQLFYVPETNASTLYVEGLHSTLINGVYNQFKERAKVKAKEKASLQ